MEQIMEMLKTMQENVDAMRQEINANTKAFKEKTDALVANIKTACQYAMEPSLKNMESNPEEKETVLEQHDIPNEEVAIHPLKECRSERSASQDVTGANPKKIGPDPGKMQSVEEHPEIPQEEAVVTPIKGRKKRRRARKPAAGRRGEPNELTRGDCESGKKLAAACKKIARRATVAWRKRKAFRRIGTKELAAARIRTTRCAKVARRKRRNYEGTSVEQGRRKNETKNKFSRGTQKLRTLGRIQLMCQEGTNGTRNLDVKEQMRLGNQRTSRGIYRKSTGLEITK
jgi:hypothetical protein